MGKLSSSGAGRQETTPLQFSVPTDSVLKVQYLDTALLDLHSYSVQTSR